MSLVHHHLIYQAKVGRSDLGEQSEAILEKFLYDLLEDVGMTCLIPAQLKFSHQKAWTGLLGIVTSHIAFHYWTAEQYVQLDIYSCKLFDKLKAVSFLDEFWQASNTKALCINRETGYPFNIEKLA